MSHLLSFDLGTALSRSTGLCSSSHQTRSPSTCTRDYGHSWLAVWRVQHLGLVLNLVEALAATCLLAVNVTCVPSWARSTTHRSSCHFHASHSYRTSHPYRTSHSHRTSLRAASSFASTVDNSFCDVKPRLFQREACCTVGDMLVGLTHSNHHVVERFLVRDIVNCDDVVCVLVVVTRGCHETLSFRSSPYTRVLN